MSDSVLQGSTRMGDFVHANQQMSGDVGFKNVSRIWFDQCKTFDQGLEDLENARRQREDINENLGDAVIKSDGSSLKVMVDGREFNPTHHSLLQLATWLDTPHTLVNVYSTPKLLPNGQVKYQRDSRDIDMIVKALRLGQERNKSDKPMLFRTYSDGTLRAVLSDRYAIIDNRWYLEVLRELFPDGRLSHWRGDADTIYGNVLIPDTLRAEQDSEYGGMLSLSNCEIGKRRLAQYPSIFRAICMNGCIWDQEKGNVLNRIHRGKINLDDLRKNILDNVNKQIPLMNDHVELFLSMRNRKVTTKVTKLFAQLCEDNGWTKGQLNQVADEYRNFEKVNDPNAFAIINAITRAGQKLDNQSWVDFDVIAGKLVHQSANSWEALNLRANALTDEAVAEMYTVAA